jgi:hypothetical protein
MKETLKVINRMVKDGVIEEYAIGGAVAAIYYLEPFDTADLGVFVQISTTVSEMTILAPIYEYLIKRGHKAQTLSDGAFFREQNRDGFQTQGASKVHQVRSGNKQCTEVQNE